ncbi:MAG: redoxin domain-containing protein [Phycisphaerales bacterium]
MAIRTGDTAAPFELPHAVGQTANLAESFGSEPVVLLFFPLAFSPTCTDEMCTMRDDWNKWTEVGAKVYGITVDSPFITDKFRQDLDIPFPILSDFNTDVSRTWGACYDEFHGMRNVPKRAAFVVAANGTVAYDWVSEDAAALPDFDAIRAAVQGTTANT